MLAILANSEAAGHADRLTGRIAKSRFNQPAAIIAIRCGIVCAACAGAIARSAMIHSCHPRTGFAEPLIMAVRRGSSVERATVACDAVHQDTKNIFPCLPSTAADDASPAP